MLKPILGTWSSVYAPKRKFVLCLINANAKVQPEFVPRTAATRSDCHNRQLILSSPAAIAGSNNIALYDTCDPNDQVKDDYCTV